MELLVVAVAMCWLASTAAAQGAYYGAACTHGGMCVPGLDGCCAPRRVTYGYYPTVWRQWPLDGPTMAAPQAEPIATPQPAQAEAAPEAGQGEPAADEPMQPPPAQQPPPDADLPFDTSPVEPSTPTPSEPQLPTAPMQTPEPTPRDAFPTLPPPTQPRETDAPPAMPSEDPFKDEPPALPPSSQNEKAPPVQRADDAPPQPPKDTHEGDAAGTAQAKVLDARPLDAKPRHAEAAAHWHVTATGSSKSSEHMVQQMPRGAEPTLVPPAELRVATAQGYQATGSLAKQNPLRPGSSGASRPPVRPAAHWARDATSERVAAPAPKHNPLRSN